MEDSPEERKAGAQSVETTSTPGSPRALRPSVVLDAMPSSGYDARPRPTSRDKHVDDSEAESYRKPRKSTDVSLARTSDDEGDDDDDDDDGNGDAGVAKCKEAEL